MELSADPQSVTLDGETRQLDRRVRILWMLRRSAFWVILGVVWIVAGAASADLAVTLLAIIVAVAAVLAAIVSAVLSYRYWGWSAHDDALEITHGVISRHLSIVPYHRVQQIDIERGPLERLLGISTLVLRSAAATTDARVPGIAFEHSESLRHALLARVGSDDAV